MTKLIYIGNGTAIPDVPARDLDHAEAGRFGIARLVESGLYVTAPEPKPATRARKDEGVDVEEGD